MGYVGGTPELNWRQSRRLTPFHNTARQSFVQLGCAGNPHGRYQAGLDRARHRGLAEYQDSCVLKQKVTHRFCLRRQHEIPLPGNNVQPAAQVLHQKNIASAATTLTRPF